MTRAELRKLRKIVQAKADMLVTLSQALPFVIGERLEVTDSISKKINAVLDDRKSSVAEVKNAILWQKGLHETLQRGRQCVGAAVFDTFRFVAEHVDKLTAAQCKALGMVSERDAKRRRKRPKQG